MSGAYYNEIEPFKAEVLREAIRAGAIAPGEVDERSIRDVRPEDLRGFTQCHFFAGGGFWSLALRLAGWPDDRPAWTASTPCPSFSAAGKGLGFSDPRHLWPEVERLARVHRPPVLFGEQVASAIGHGWLDLVQADLEALDYAVGKAVIGACSVGAPHIRQRLYFVAHAGRPPGDAELVDQPGCRPWGRTPEADSAGIGAHCATDGMDDPASPRCDGQVEGPERHPREEARLRGSGERCQDGGLGIAKDSGLQECELHAGSIRKANGSPAREGLERGSDAGRLGNAAKRGFGIDGGASGRAGHADSADRARGLADADGADPGDGGLQRSGELRQQPQDGGAGGVDDAERNRLGARRDDDAEDERQFAGAAIDHFRASPLNGLWRDADWIGCRDGKWRPVESGTFPLAHGSPARVGRLRLYGDAICVPAAQAFIEAYLLMECSCIFHT